MAYTGYVILTSNGRTLRVSAYVTGKRARLPSKNGDSAVSGDGNKRRKKHEFNNSENRRNP
jgi:hypothetical protein